MKKFLFRLLFFSILPLLCMVGIEWAIREIPNDYAFKNSFLAHHSEEIQHLILGSSHTLYGLNPAYFQQSSFNASHVSQSIDYDFALLKKYEQQLKQLKTVILPISYFSLYGNLATTNEVWRIKNYIIYYEIDCQSYSSATLIGNMPLGNLLFPPPKQPYSLVNINDGLSCYHSSLSYCTELFSQKLKVGLKRVYKYYVLGQNERHTSETGWGINYHSSASKNLAETGRKAALRHTADNIQSKTNQESFKQNKLILETIAAWCKDKNIQLLLFTPPATKAYRENISTEQWQMTLDAVKALAEQNAHCFYYNLLDSPVFSPNDFFDGDHLNELGAKKLSLWIDKHISK